MKVNLPCRLSLQEKGEGGTTEDKLDTGLVSTHAYSVTSVVKVKLHNALTFFGFCARRI